LEELIDEEHVYLYEFKVENMPLENVEKAENTLEELIQRKSH